MKFNSKENLPFCMETYDKTYRWYVKTLDGYFFREVTLFIIFVRLFFLLRHFRSSRPLLLCIEGVRRNFVKFTGKHLCQSLFFFFSPRDEISSQQKRVNSKRRFTVDRDDFILGRVSSRDEISRVNTLFIIQNTE